METEQKNENQEKINPNQIINRGIYLLCLILGMWLAFFLRTTGLVPIPSQHVVWIGGVTGLIIGVILCRLRPQYGQEKGIWKRINHFVLMQMNIESAFARKRK